MYKKYQNNIKLSERLTTEILKGLAEGESITSLFLKAVKAIGLMTNDNVILAQTESDLETIYGDVLEQQEPLQLQLNKVEERLKALEESYLWVDDPNDKRRVERAIEAHRRKAEALRGKLSPPTI